MDEKDETTRPPGERPESAKRIVRGEGHIRARERSFRNQRAATLRPADELEAEASGTASEAEHDNTGNEHDHASQSGAGRQNLITQYRRRQRKRDETPKDATREERAPTHSSSPASSESPDDDVDPP